MDYDPKTEINICEPILRIGYALHLTNPGLTSIVKCGGVERPWSSELTDLELTQALLPYQLNVLGEDTSSL